MSQHRRELLKPHIKEKYAKLCNRPDKEGPELLGGSDIDEKISTMGKTQSISKKDFLGQRSQRGGRDQHASSSRNYHSGQNTWHGNPYNNRHRADAPGAHRTGGKMRYHAGEGRRKPYHGKGSGHNNTNRWKKN